jgi:hypothetical protein
VRLVEEGKALCVLSLKITFGVGTQEFKQSRLVEITAFYFMVHGRILLLVAVLTSP